MKPDIQFDERGGYTSASSAQADFHCPGRHIAQRGILKVSASKDAEAGTKSHLVFSGELQLSDVPESQRKILRQARIIEVGVHAAWLEMLGLPPLQSDDVAKRARREQRLWYHIHGEPVHSGQADAVFFAGGAKHALVEDLKSLYGDTPDPDVNAQLRDLAVMTWKEHGVETVTVFINQPAVAWGLDKQQLTTYTKKELQAAEKEMVKRVLASNDINARRTPNAVSCKFCRACGTDRCPESTQAAIISARNALKHDGTWGESAEARGARLAEYKAAADRLKKMIETAKEEIAKDPEWAKGWTISKGGSTRSIPAERNLAVAAFMRECAPTMRGNDIGNALIKMCSISVPSLETWCIEQGLTKEQFAEQATFIELSERAGSLKQEKKPEQ